MNATDVFIWENEVRDSELDFQGIVNNANYFIYLAQARYKYLKTLNIDIMAMHECGFDLVLTRSEIDFKASLVGGDEFIVTSKLEPLGKIRFVFNQQIIHKSEHKVIIEAKNIGVCIDRSQDKPVVPDELKFIFHTEKSV